MCRLFYFDEFADRQSLTRLMRPWKFDCLHPFTYWYKNTTIEVAYSIQR